MVVVMVVLMIKKRGRRITYPYLQPAVRYDTDMIRIRVCPGLRGCIKKSLIISEIAAATQAPEPRGK